MRLLKILPAAVLISAVLAAPAAAGTVTEIIDTPTASPVEFNSYSLSFRFYRGGSILTRLFYGMIMQDLTLGLSFDAENVVGTGKVEPRRPYIYVKLPIYSGGGRWPALSLGFDEQGFGKYDDKDELYQYPPAGFFLVATAGGVAPGLNLGAGVNAEYTSAEGASEKITGFANFDFTVGPEFMFVGEVRSLGNSSAGNAGFRYLLRPELHFEFAVINIGGRGDPERILRATYKGAF